jgi:UDP-3-O-[3-hydroxymyristoyl] glucosamine N-acyltransferase
MIDTNFFGDLKKMRASELAAICGFEMSGGNDFEISNVSTLENAAATELSFFSNRKYINDLRKTAAGAVIIAKDDVKELPDGVMGLVCGNVMIGCANALQVLCPNDKRVSRICSAKATVGSVGKIAEKICCLLSCRKEQSSHSPQSSHICISASARIGENCRIGEYVCIGNDVEIGDNVVIGNNTVIENNCKIGSGCCIRNNVSISHSIIGKDAKINSGARIGESGFGIIPTGEAMVYVPQLGRVIIGDRVRIGANTTIDRGSLGDTSIGNDTIIDNLVQIGHNVTIGERSIIVAQVGIAGSTKIGNGVVLAGQVGISGHIEIGDGVMVAAKSGIASSVAPGKVVGGIPAVDVGTWKRQVVFLKNAVTKKKKDEQKNKEELNA